MQLKVLLPFQVFAEINGVQRIIAETSQGSFGIFPQRLDCVAALEPGILTYKSAASDGEVYIAVDEGMLVKTGREVLVSVRNAIGGGDLGELHNKVRSQFLELDEQELSIRSTLAKLESGFIRRFAGLKHE
ncbi:MAG: F0F1 ATP synthase subunit epsilon [Gammaproteobacteria bacterium]|nr:F0F1 ATP synthase subunit epsilon [Gammaproteobacteria bacterium]